MSSYNETSATVTINSEAVVFNFTNGQLIPITSAWQQGDTPMFFYRTVNDGTNDVTVVCDPDGKLWVTENDAYLIKNQNGFAWAVSTASQQLITACGGSATMDFAAQDEEETTVLEMNDYVVVIDLDGQVTVGTITSLSIEVTGKLQVFKDTDCTSYADGTESDLYIRVNVDIPINSYLSFGQSSVVESYISVGAENETTQEQGYAIVYVDWQNVDTITGAIEQGSIIHVHTETPYDNPAAGLVTIFGNE